MIDKLTIAATFARALPRVCNLPQRRVAVEVRAGSVSITILGGSTDEDRIRVVEEVVAALGGSDWTSTPMPASNGAHAMFVRHAGIDEILWTVSCDIYEPAVLSGLPR